VEIEKTFVDKMPNTRTRLTREGRCATDDYWKRRERLRDGAAKSKSEAE